MIYFWDINVDIGSVVVLGDRYPWYVKYSGIIRS